jgi:uncharacterized protein YbjT (DUF2867 family)
MRVFLTGATGVIGRRVSPLLVGLDGSASPSEFAGKRHGMTARAAAEGGPAPVFVLRCKGATLP